MLASHHFRCKRMGLSLLHKAITLAATVVVHEQLGKVKFAERFKDRLEIFLSHIEMDVANIQAMEGGRAGLTAIVWLLDLAVLLCLSELHNDWDVFERTASELKSLLNGLFILELNIANTDEQCQPRSGVKCREGESGPFGSSADAIFDDLRLDDGTSVFLEELLEFVGSHAVGELLNKDGAAVTLVGWGGVGLGFASSAVIRRAAVRAVVAVSSVVAITTIAAITVISIVATRGAGSRTATSSAVVVSVTSAVAVVVATSISAASIAVAAAVATSVAAGAIVAVVAVAAAVVVTRAVGAAFLVVSGVALILHRQLLLVGFLLRGGQQGLDVQTRHRELALDNDLLW